MLTRDDAPDVPEKAALVIAPRGMLVEQLAGDPTDRAIQQLTGQENPETLWRDLDDAIRAATDDDRIQALYLGLNQMAGGGLSKLQALRAAIDEFKASGKPVIATSDFYLRDSYYLASAADEIYLHKLGMVLLDGYGRYRTYYKEGIDKARDRLERLQGRRVQVGGRAVPAQRHVGGGPRGEPRVDGRSVALVPRRRRRRPGHHTRGADRRHRSLRRADRGGRTATPARWRWPAGWSTTSPTATRCARA